MLESVGKYKIIGELARGGMGIVYKAEDPSLKRIVAIKQLSLAEEDDDRAAEFRERFKREAILAANLNHPNIVAIYDIDITDENAFYVMEFMKGTTLGQELLKQPGNKLSVENYWPIFSQICKGLAHASSMNLVHRDIKPDNIFILADGTAKITDFGIACSTDHNFLSRLTKPGSFLGTLCYVSPEQLQNAAGVDFRADIYSLGAMTYEVLTGRVPFSPDGGLTSMMTAIVSQEEPPAHFINNDISPAVATVIAKAMRKKPEDRYVSFEQFEADFEQAMKAPKAARASRLLSASYNASVFRAPGSTPAPGGIGAPGAGQAAPSSSARFAALTKSVPLVKNIGVITIPVEAPNRKPDPVAIYARKGRIAVVDGATKTIKIFTQDGKLAGESKSSGVNQFGSKTNGVLSKPSGVTIDVVGKIYVTDSGDHFVRIFDANGMFVRDVQNKHEESSGFAGLLVDDREGGIYLADTTNGCVHLVRSDLGTWVQKFGSKGSDDGQLRSPVRMAIDGFGQLCVLDQETSKVSVFSKQGAFQRSWGSKGSGRGQLSTPSGMAIDQADRIYIAEPAKHRVCVFSSAGDYLFSFGGLGSAPGLFNTPVDLSVDSEVNILYVVDKGNRRIQIFEILMEEPK